VVPGDLDAQNAEILQNLRESNMVLVKARKYNPGNRKAIESEKVFDEVKFKIFKFNNRTRPKDKNKILIISCFFEFGCESIALMYCIPKIIQRHPGSYIIAVGWYGREYLYRHLVDEFWEISEEYQCLREYSDAFASKSKTISKIENKLKDYGNLFRGFYMGHICLGNICKDCKGFFGSEKVDAKCEYCGSQNIIRAPMADIPYYKKFAIQVPRPSIKALNAAKKYLGPNPVGIFARGRVCYGRNLPPEFYVELIELLEKRGYTPIWLGEKQSVLPCPKEHIIDFSRLPESRDLELTLAIVSQLNFTIQFWTASTRLASMMGVPWILFESPDQIIGDGQEGMRIAMTTDPQKKKLVLAHYIKVLEDQKTALSLVEQSIDEMMDDNWEEIVGLVHDKEFILKGLDRKKEWTL
jgi:hypothetical protein